MLWSFACSSSLYVAYLLLGISGGIAKGLRPLFGFEYFFVLVSLSLAGLYCGAIIGLAYRISPRATFAKDKLWVRNTSTAWGISVAAVVLVFDALGTLDTLTPKTQIGFVIFAFTFIGITAGIGQWLVIRKHIPTYWSWGLGSIGSGFVASLIWLSCFAVINSTEGIRDDTALMAVAGATLLSGMAWGLVEGIRVNRLAKRVMATNPNGM